MMQNWFLEGTLKNLFRNLYKCEKVYNENSDYLVKQLMLKLALLEVAGWIENAFDDLYCKTQTNPTVLSEIEDKIKKIHHFSYENLKIGLTFCIGINKFIEIQNKIKEKDLSYFKTTLGNIKKLRDEYAHNHYHGTPAYMGFRDLKTNIKIIYFGIKYIEKNI